VAGARAEVWSLRLGAPAATAAETPADSVRAPLRPAAPRPVAATVGTPAGGSAAPAERAYSSLVPRLAVLAFGVLVIAFVVWWLVQNRAAPDESSGPDSEPQAVRAGKDSAAVATPPVVIPDTSLAAAPSRPESVVVDPARPPLDHAYTGGKSGGMVLLDPADIHVMEDVERNYRGWYAIHISSFQESIRARDEVAFLQSREFPVFIVFLDLGPKGKWYRVYAGPFATREEAREVKKNLDAVPQVRFTRITSIPE
jgi:hypothetical protein